MHIDLKIWSFEAVKQETNSILFREKHLIKFSRNLISDFADVVTIRYKYVGRPLKVNICAWASNVTASSHHGIAEYDSQSWQSGNTVL